MEQEELKAATHPMEVRDYTLTLFFCNLCSLERTFSSNQIYIPALTWREEGGGKKLIDLPYSLSSLMAQKRSLNLAIIFRISLCSATWGGRSSQENEPQHK